MPVWCLLASAGNTPLLPDCIMCVSTKQSGAHVLVLAHVMPATKTAKSVVGNLAKTKERWPHLVAVALWPYLCNPTTCEWHARAMWCEQFTCSEHAVAICIRRAEKLVGYLFASIQNVVDL